MAKDDEETEDLADQVLKALGPLMKSAKSVQKYAEAESKKGGSAADDLENELDVLFGWSDQLKKLQKKLKVLNK